MFQLSDAQRASIAQAFENGLADEALQTERQRITTELQNCPGPPQALGLSSGDSVRDTIRVRAADDAQQLAAVAQLAQADWYTRRAAASGNPVFCERAQSALNGSLPSPGAGDLLDGIPLATVSRDPRDPSDGVPLTSDPPLVTLSEYALNYVDSVTAAAPLPQYLAAVYGGQVSGSAVRDQEAAADLVDMEAPEYPDWEPDALYAALRGGQV